MPESFDCPRCGAPMKYDSATQGDQETITCPYCGESVIVPESLRQHNPQVINLGGGEFKPEVIQMDSFVRPTVITLDTEAPARTGQAAKKGIGLCLVIGLVVVFILGVVGIVAYGAIKSSLTQALNPIPTGTGINAGAIVATSLAKITEMAAEPTDTPAAPPTEASLDTPTPPIDTAATAQAETTLASFNALAQQQAAWPVVLQEKFTAPDSGWNVGQDNNQYALEDLTIAANKYTWKFTSKKSMGSFSYPDMTPQTDMFVSVDMQMVTSSSYDDDQAGIVFHTNPKDESFYFFGINPQGGYWLSLYDGSNWNDMVSGTSDLIKPNQVNHLAVSIQGNEILLMINNSVVNSFEDAQPASGGAGVGLELTSAGVDATVIYSNFIIRAPKQ